MDACTHGPDPAPPGLDVDEPVQRLSAQAAAREVAALDCDGDGQSGYRVQVLYVRASNVSSRHTQYLASIRGWAGAADQIFQASAAATGGSRGLRFVHDANCLLSVPEAVVSDAGDGNFGTTITELRNQGYNRTDRIYLAFTDAAFYCGIGTLWSDDRASSANWNNSGPSYSRVDRGCWNGTVAAHELMHNLGGVQDSAPNSSLGGHCIDEYDIMCYSDAGAGLPQMRVDCIAQTLNSTRFDCGQNDYFHTNPGSENYLFDHWNPANNRFLTDAVPLSPPPVPSVLDDTTTSTGKDKKDKDKKGKGKKGKHKKKKRR